MPLQGLTLIKNGRVVTLDDKNTVADAVLIAGNRIAGIGEGRTLKDAAPGAEEIDLKGAVLYPGFIEPHSHVIGYGLVESRAAAFYNRNLAPVTSREQMQEVIAEEVREKAKGEWICGRGYAVGRWNPAHLLEKEDIDAIAPDNPVALNDLGGHITMTNSLALRLAGIDRSTPEPDNGRIYRNAHGEPNGILKDSAQLPVFDQIDLPTADQFLEAARVATHRMAAMGITTVHHLRNMLPGGYLADQHVPFIELERRGDLPIRVWLMMEAYRHIHHEGDDQHLSSLVDLGQRTGFGHKVKIGATKIISDGWMDARTSANYEEYKDEPHEQGYMWRSEEDYQDLVKKSHENGLQLAIHCDGFRSADVIMNCYERALSAKPYKDNRHRLEHVPMLTDEQIARIQRLGLAVCTVPSYRNTPWYKDMIRSAYGDRTAEQFGLRYKSLMEGGTLVFGGSDCHPCIDEWLHPLGQIYLYSEEGPLNESEKFSRSQALDLFTRNAAKASYEEHDKGSIEVGKLADLVVLSADPLDANGSELRNIEVLRTIVDGKTVYQK